ERKQAESHIRTLNQQLMKAQESERQRISRDLHDHIAQDLSTLKIGCETLFDKQPEVPNGIRQRISDFSKILQDCIHAIRDLAYDLRPPALDEIGLVQTVFQYCKDFSEKNGLKVDFISAGMDSLNLDFDIEINLYRLIQESFNNIKKHAEASWVTVKMTASSPNIILRIEDSGKGFNVAERMAAAHNQKRMGIRSMQERVSLLNGRMRIQSHPGNGTQIVIEVPCKEKNNDSEETNIDCR
ncbi:MAG TPA: sensor histidine kinase, partial [Desulfatiglandales bacterium]|nr:sensor histidine kinase [Desulfatiglandales bacterium]